MKKTFLAVALAVGSLSTVAQAGGLAPAVVEKPVIIADTGSSSASGIIIPLMLLLFVAAAVASSGSNGAPV